MDTCVCFSDDTICSGVGVGIMPSQVLLVNSHVK